MTANISGIPVTNNYLRNIATRECDLKSIAAKVTIIAFPVFILLTLLADLIIAIANYLTGEKTPTANYEADECPICLDTFNVPVRLECGHIFDLSCIKSWFSQGSVTCPNDRKPVDLKKIVYLGFVA